MPDAGFFWTTLAAKADRTAIIDQSGQIFSYAMLDRLAADWVQRLQAMTPTDTRPLVALELSMTVDAIAAYLGCLQAGFPVILGEPGMLGLQSPIVMTYGPEILISQASGAVAAQASGAVAGPAPDADLHPDLCILLSTSGSTGDPKLVRLSQTNIDANAQSIATYLTLTPADRAMATLPLFYSYGMSVLNSYLAAGASLVLTDHSVIDAGFRAQVGLHHPTSMALVPHQVDLLLGQPEPMLPTAGLRYITQAGGRLAPEQGRRFIALGAQQGWDLVIMYGQTEAGPRISYVPPALLPGAADTIGQAIPGGRLWLRDDTGAQIDSPLTPGELIYEGPNVMMGYATARAALSQGPELPVLSTGDIAEITPDGLFRIVGRLKRFVKIFGLRLSLDQIEALLGRKGIVGHAVAVEDNLVLLLRDPSQQTTAAEVVAQEYDLPTSVLHTGALAQLPLLSSGKTDMQALNRIAATALATAQTKAVQLRKAMGGDIALALATATRSRTVGPTDSFNSLGGDSLGYLQVQMTLEDLLGGAPPGWENMPLSQIEALIATGTTARPQVGMDVLLRIFAISLVVAQHASNYPLYGGTWILIMLMGFSVGRFQLRQITEGRPLQIALKMAYPIIPIYFAIILAYQFLRDDIPTPLFLLFGNFRMPTEGSFYGPYWFVSLYAQLVLIVVSIALVPVLRRLAGQNSWAFASVLLAMALGLEIAIMLASPLSFAPNLNGGVVLSGTFPVLHPATRSLFACLPIFFLGWSIQAAQGRWQAGLTAVLALATLYLFDVHSERFGPPFFLLLTIPLLMAIKTLPLPAMLVRLCNVLAAASLFTYLTHGLVVHGVRYLIEAQYLIGWPLATLLIVILAHLLATQIKRGFDTASAMFGQSWSSPSQLSETRLSDAGLGQSELVFDKENSTRRAGSISRD